MKTKKKHVNEFQSYALARHLIENHSIGGIRDEADLNNIKYHSRQTITSMIDFIKNIKGNNKEKILYLENSLLELEKFHGK